MKEMTIDEIAGSNRGFVEGDKYKCIYAFSRYYEEGKTYTVIKNNGRLGLQDEGSEGSMCTAGNSKFIRVTNSPEESEISARHMIEITIQENSFLLTYEQACKLHTALEKVGV